MVRISVIVPVYNMEQYLVKCLDSILNQTMQELEIILVNDGSTDNSAKICKHYQEKYPEKIQYLEKKNGGLSDARNYGISYATGEYLSFVDPDDYISPNLYQKLEPYMKQKNDMIKFKLIKVEEQEETMKEIKKVHGPVFENETGEEAFEHLYTTDVMTEVSCIYLYRREFWIDHQFSFTKDTYHEDFGLIPYMLLKAKAVSSTPYFGYYYLQTQNSITRDKEEKKTLKKAQDMLKHYDILMERLQKDQEISNKAREMIKSYDTNAIILKISDLKKEEQDIYIKEIKKRKLYQNIRPTSVKQFFKRILLEINVKLYLRIR